jgi:hypothetical protein
MSRGLGRVQRALLVALNGHDDLTAAELAVIVYDRERRGIGRTWHVGDAKMRAVRRALAGLARDGLVHQCEAPSGQTSARWRRSNDRGGGE